MASSDTKDRAEDGEGVNELLPRRLDGMASGVERRIGGFGSFLGIGTDEWLTAAAGRSKMSQLPP
jgi:hypothetical protein